MGAEATRLAFDWIYSLRTSRKAAGTSSPLFSRGGQ